MKGGIIAAFLRSQAFKKGDQYNRGLRTIIAEGGGDEEKATRRIAQDLLERAFRGKASLLVAALLDSRSIGKKDLQQIKKLIEEKEKRGE